MKFKTGASKAVGFSLALLSRPALARLFDAAGILLGGDNRRADW
jgi:hypothetical protein